MFQPAPDSLLLTLRGVFFGRLCTRSVSTFPMHTNGFVLQQLTQAVKPLAQAYIYFSVNKTGYQTTCILLGRSAV